MEFCEGFPIFSSSVWHKEKTYFDDITIKNIEAKLMEIRVGEHGDVKYRNLMDELLFSPDSTITWKKMAVVVECENKKPYIIVKAIFKFFLDI